MPWPQTVAQPHPRAPCVASALLDDAPGGLADALADVWPRARRVPAGTEIAFEGDRVETVTWVLAGWVALSKNFDDGRRQIVDLVLPPDLVRLVAADGATAPCRVTALTDAVVAPWSRAQLARRLAAAEGLRAAVERLAAAAAARQTERMLRLGQGTAYERVAHVLLELFVRLEAAHQTAGPTVPLPVTQTELGDLTGLTSVHVCRTLRRLARNGVIRQTDHAVVILDLPALCRISGAVLEAFRRTILAPGVGVAGLPSPLAAT